MIITIDFNQCTGAELTAYIAQLKRLSPEDRRDILAYHLDEHSLKDITENVVLATFLNAFRPDLQVLEEEEGLDEEGFKMRLLAHMSVSEDLRDYVKTYFPFPPDDILSYVESMSELPLEFAEYICEYDQTTLVEDMETSEREMAQYVKHVLLERMAKDLSVRKYVMDYFAVDEHEIFFLIESADTFDMAFYEYMSNSPFEWEEEEDEDDEDDF